MEGATAEQIQAGQGRHERNAVLEPQGPGQGGGGQRGSWAAGGRGAGRSRRRRGGEEADDEERGAERLLPGAAGLRHAGRAAVCVPDPVPERGAGEEASVGESAGGRRR